MQHYTQWDIYSFVEYIFLEFRGNSFPKNSFFIVFLFSDLKYWSMTDEFTRNKIWVIATVFWSDINGFVFSGNHENCNEIQFGFGFKNRRLHQLSGKNFQHLLRSWINFLNFASDIFKNDFLYQYLQSGTLFHSFMCYTYVQNTDALTA